MNLQADWDAIRAYVSAQMQPLSFDAAMGLDLNLYRLRDAHPDRFFACVAGVARLEQNGLTTAPLNFGFDPGFARSTLGDFHFEHPCNHGSCVDAARV